MTSCQRAIPAATLTLSECFCTELGISGLVVTSAITSSRTPRTSFPRIRA